MRRGPFNAILPQCVMAWWPEDWPATPLSCASQMPREELRTWFGDAGG